MHSLFNQHIDFLREHAQLVVREVPVSLASVPGGASGALIANAPQAGLVLWLYGKDPGKGFGIPLYPGESFLLEDSQDLTQLRWMTPLEKTAPGLLTFQFIIARHRR